MKLQTSINKVDLDLDLNHESRALFIGSCFAQNIGKKLQEVKFEVSINPLGISYNPISLFNLLERSLDQRDLQNEDVKREGERYFSFELHSTFSSLKPQNLLEVANLALKQQKTALEKADYLFISLGTAWVHIHKENSLLVNNCHKLPSQAFEKKLLSIEDIVSSWEHLVKKLKKGTKKEVKIIFTVSPVRHLKDGFHENQLSKATLLLAVEEICKGESNCFYFPSYEIMMDELRDYRFYDRDLVHPSELAIDIIWDHFRKACISNESNQLIDQVEKLINSFHHRAFEPRSLAHQKFLKKLLAEMETIQNKYPINFEDEIAEVRSQIVD